MAAKVSIIITAYDREQFLPTAIESVLAQTYPNFELLIWDDGSRDRSVYIAEQYAAKDPRVQWVAAPHQGLAHSLRDAIARTHGDYLGWVDSDDFLEPTALQETTAILDQQPAIGLVYTDYRDMDATGNILGYGKRCRIPYSRERLLLDFMTFQFRLIRRTALERAGGIDVSFACAEDYDLCLRLSEVTQVRHLQKPLYRYRHHPKTISQEQRLEQIYAARAAIAQALKRRNLSHQYEVHVELIGRFSLRPIKKEP